MSLPDDIVPGKKKKKAKKAKKAKPWQGYLWTVAKVKAYDGTGRHRPEFDLKPGQRIYGKVNKKKFNDGRYFQWHEQPHAIYYPLDAGGFSHSDSLWRTVPMFRFTDAPATSFADSASLFSSCFARLSPLAACGPSNVA
jgi:hypothetical protein